MDRRLLEILRCPATHQPLAFLNGRELSAVNHAIAAGQVEREDGSPQSVPLEAALLTHDRKRIYRIEDGIPVLLAGDAIPADRIAGFSA